MGQAQTLKLHPNYKQSCHPKLLPTLEMPQNQHRNPGNQPMLLPQSGKDTPPMLIKPLPQTTQRPESTSKPPPELREPAPIANPERHRHPSTTELHPPTPPLHLMLLLTSIDPNAASTAHQTPETKNEKKNPNPTQLSDSQPQTIKRSRHHTLLYVTKV